MHKTIFLNIFFDQKLRIRIRMQGPHSIRIRIRIHNTATVPDNRLDRAKDLLSGNLHVVPDLGKDGGLHVVALLPRPLAPNHQPCPLLHPAPDVGQDGVHLSLGDLGLGYSDYDVYDVPEYIGVKSYSKTLLILSRFLRIGL
jgi:hypothetical protein